MRFAEGMRVIVVAGIAVGVVVVGIGSRLAMFVLRFTSPDRARGVISDDGFEIGRVTLSGTYNLLVIGAAVGVIGACAYRLVRRWLIGPLWFRRLTLGFAAAAVAGSMLVHRDGVDFTLLQPTWLTVGLFVALPGVFGVLTGVAVDAVERPGSWTRVGRRQWVLPVVAVVCFPLALFPLIAASMIVGIGVLAGTIGGVERVRAAPAYGLLVRGFWLLVAATGLLALVNDISDLS